MAKFTLRCTVETTRKLQFTGSLLLFGGVISERWTNSYARCWEWQFD